MLPGHPHCHTLKPGCKGDVCLVDEKPDKELFGILIVGARGDRYCLGQRVLSCMMCAWLLLFCPSHSFRVLNGAGLVGRNPTMNTPRLHGGGRIASSSLFLLVVLLL